MVCSKWIGAAGLMIVAACGLPTQVSATAGTSVVMASETEAAQGEGRVGLIEISGALKSRPGPISFFGPDDEGTLAGMVRTIRDAGDREDLSGFVIRLKDAELGRADLDELSAAIAYARGKGKVVQVFAENFGPAELLLGAAADQVLLQSGGGVMLPGLHMEEMFLADTLNWMGLKADMVQVGDFKGANEQMTRNAPSPEWELNINQLLDSMYGQIRGTLKAGRKLDDAKLDAAMKAAWMADGDDAKAVGLIDEQVDLPLLAEYAKEKQGAASARFVKLGEAKEEMPDFAANPFALLTMLSEPAQKAPTGPTIAVLHVDGAIIDGDSTTGGLFGGSDSVGSRTIRNALEDILDEDNIKGVIVRVDSPGGSAIASEVMWQGLKRVAEKKPVWVSVGSMAASGGYYVASAGSRIYVNPSSIVGSIGVVGGKISMGGLYDWAKVKVVGRSRGPMAEMFASNKPWGPGEIERVREKMTDTFELFKSRVAAGRPGIDLSKTAGGWLFTGDKAIAMNMADEIGGLHEALSDMADALKLEEYETADYPAPKSFEEYLKDMMGGMVSGPNVQSGVPSDLVRLGRGVMGPRAWEQFCTAAEGLMQLRSEPVILMTPRVMLFE